MVNSRQIVLSPNKAVPPAPRPGELAGPDRPLIQCPGCGQVFPAKPPEDQRSADAPAWGAAGFVWGIWFLLLLADLALLGRYDSIIPQYEDWTFLFHVPGKEPITFQFLWQQEYEHRYPLIKAALLAALKLSRGDFRGPIFLYILALGGLSMALVRVAKHLRGRTSYADAFFPLAILPWGFDDFGYLWNMYAYRLPALILGTLFVIVIPRISRLTPGWATLAAICLVALPLCSAGGLLYLPFSAVLLGYCAFLSWRSPGVLGKCTSLVLLAGVGVALLITALYFRHYVPSDSYIPHSHKALEILSFAWGVLTGSLGGESLESFWPISGWVVGVLLVISTGILVWSAWQQPGPGRRLALGLLCLLGGCMTVALGLGWGRTASGWWGGHYGAFALPLPWCIFFALGSCRSQRWGTIGQTALLVGMGVMAWYTYSNSLKAAREGLAVQQAFEQDLRIGCPPYLLNARYRYRMRNDPDTISNGLRILRDAGVGYYRYLQDDPPFQKVPLPLEPLALHHVVLDLGRIQSTGDGAYLTLALPRPMLVAYVQIEFGTAPERFSSAVGVSWKGGEADFPLEPQVSERPWAATWKVCIGDTIDQIRLYPGTPPAEFNIARVVIFVPEPQS